MLWGAEMAMVFQDPMTSLNPVVTIGRQLTEHVRYHLDMGRKEANEVAVALLRSVHIPEAEKRLDNYPHQMSGGCVSVSASRSRWHVVLACCSPTSRPRHST